MLSDYYLIGDKKRVTVGSLGVYISIQSEPTCYLSY